MTFDIWTVLPTEIRSLRQSVKRWLAAPVFPGDEVKTHQASVLNFLLLWQPHLIWMDMHMPEIDGRTAARHIKATTQGQQTVIIAVSASIRDEDHADGCDDFMCKPFREEEIVVQLAHRLGVRFTCAKPPADASPHRAEAAPVWPAADLPAGWLVRVRQAALAADAVELLRLAAEVELAAPVVSRSLLRWVDAFDYDAILCATGDEGDRSKVTP